MMTNQDGDGEEDDEEGKAEGVEEEKEKGKKHEVNGGRREGEGEGREVVELEETAALEQSIKQAVEKRRASKALAG